MTQIKLDHTKKLWNQISKFSSCDNFKFELEIHKKILEFFHPGDFYYYIFDCSVPEIEFASDTVYDIHPINRLKKFSIEYLFNAVHPDDLEYVIEFEKKVTEFFVKLPVDKVLKYKVQYDFRAKGKNGKYIRLFHQAMTIQTNEAGAVLRVLCVHTDITDLKVSNSSSLSFIGVDDEPSFKNVCTGFSIRSSSVSPLSKREKEVLLLIMKGQTTRMIAEKLFISELTVSVHRKNIHRKSNTKTTLELAKIYT